MRQLLRALLILSVGGNLLLVMACGLRLVHTSEPARSRDPTPTGPPPAARVFEKITTDTVVVAGVPGTLDWRAVESDDYRRYIANLRAVGCPEKTIRDIIVADVNELYRRRFLLSFPLTNRVEYWKPGDALANLIDQDQVARLQEFAKEKREFITTLLGTDYNGDLELTSIRADIFMERLLGFLTPEKRTAMKELEAKYNARLLNTFKDLARGDTQASKAVLAAKDEEALKILSPEEKEELRSAPIERLDVPARGVGGFRTHRAGIPEGLPPHEAVCRGSGPSQLDGDRPRGRRPPRANPHRPPGFGKGHEIRNWHGAVCGTNARNRLEHRHRVRFLPALVPFPQLEWTSRGHRTASRLPAVPGENLQQEASGHSRRLMRGKGLAI